MYYKIDLSNYEPREVPKYQEFNNWEQMEWNEVQLDILREEKQSDKFFDDKINFLLGVTSKTSEQVKEDNLLHFYLSSVTIRDFKYEPKKNTSKLIWEYLLSLPFSASVLPRGPARNFYNLRRVSYTQVAPEGRGKQRQEGKKIEKALLPVLVLPETFPFTLW